MSHTSVVEMNNTELCLNYVLPFDQSTKHGRFILDVFLCVSV